MSANERLYLLKDTDIEELISAVNEIPDEGSRKRVSDAVIEAFANNQQRTVDFLAKLAEGSAKTILKEILAS